jgi:hypothetical protein
MSKIELREDFAAVSKLKIPEKKSIDDIKRGHTLPYFSHYFAI